MLLLPPGPGELLQIGVIEPGGLEIFLGQPLKDFFPQDQNVRRSLNSYPDLLAADFEKCDPDLVSNHQAFTYFSGQDQQGLPPLCLQAMQPGTLCRASVPLSDDFRPFRRLIPWGSRLQQDYPLQNLSVATP